MSAIENCRSAVLGGHVERCQDCGQSRIAYNSRRNRHCPKCQGAAAKDWLAAREADLLPVGYFHLVFTLPAEIAPIAYQNKGKRCFGGTFRREDGEVMFGADGGSDTCRFQSISICRSRSGASRYSRAPAGGEVGRRRRRRRSSRRATGRAR